RPGRRDRGRFERAIARRAGGRNRLGRDLRLDIFFRQAFAVGALAAGMVSRFAPRPQTGGSMTRPIRKAVFPVAGLGTRFLPATKALPKEMLPIVDKPLIHYAVEEAKAAGIEEFFFVTGRAKSAIEDHFDRAYELEATLRERGKTELQEELE